MQMKRRTVMAGILVAGCVAPHAVKSLVTFSTSDGALLNGVSYGSGRHGVVLVPGGHGVGETWDQQARRLVELGFRALAINYRGRGSSPQGLPDDEKAQLDVLAAVQHLRAEGIEEISVVGASWGGWAAGTAAIGSPGLIDRLVLIAHSPFDNPHLLTGRKLFVVAAEDRDGAGRKRLDSISDQYARAPDPKKLVVLDGAAHAQFIFLSPQQDRLHSEIEAFLTAP